MHNITRITATVQATQPVAWPHFAGSSLRGAFGRALRRAVCITGQDKCTACPLRNSCAYGVVFDPAAPAQPLHPSFKNGLPRYLVQPPALGSCQLIAGQSQSFDLMLLPGTQVHQSLIQHILQPAVEKELFQPGLFKLLKTEVRQIKMPNVSVRRPVLLPDNDIASPEPATHPTNACITLSWLTPLRLQNQGKPIFKSQQLDAIGLVRALLRRHLQWLQISNQMPDDTDATTPQQDLLSHAQACNLDTRHMQWHDIHRHSGQQNRTLPLGGLIGSATLAGEATVIKALLPLLQQGERLNIGKETVMGLGRYQLGQLIYS